MHLNELTKGDAVIVTDVGQHQMVACRYAKYQSSQKAILPVADWAQWVLHCLQQLVQSYGAPDRTVVAIIGDGGFQMTIQELGTIMQFEPRCKDHYS